MFNIDVCIESDQLVLNQCSSAAPLLECGTLKESSGRGHQHQGCCVRKKKPIIIILSSVTALFLIGLTVIGGFLILQYSSKNNGSSRTMSINNHLHKNYPLSSEALVGTENDSSVRKVKLLPLLGWSCYLHNLWRRNNIL